jgi:hypothetical protein
MRGVNGPSRAPAESRPGFLEICRLARPVVHNVMTGATSSSSLCSDPLNCAVHSFRRTAPTVLCARTGDARWV